MRLRLNLKIAPTGTNVNKILSTTRNVDINGNAYLTASEWKAISTTQNNPIVKETNNTISTLRKAASSGMPQSSYTYEISKALNNISGEVKGQTTTPQQTPQRSNNTANDETM